MNRKGYIMKKKNQIGKGIVRFIDRVFGLVLAAGIVLAVFGLALEWILVRDRLRHCGIHSS